MKSDNTTPNNSYVDKVFKCYDSELDFNNSSCKDDLIGHKCHDYDDSFIDYFNNQKTLDTYFNYEFKNKSFLNNDLSDYSSSKKNLRVFNHKGNIAVKQFRVKCPCCGSKNVIEDGYYDKPVIFDKLGELTVKVKRYACNKCNKKFSTDLSSIVRPNSNVSNKVLDDVRKYYSIFDSSVRKIQEALKEMNNVSISHQEVQNILLNYITDYDSKLEEYSGYYIFDSLWVKVDELGDKYVFLLVLIDARHRTVISYQLVEKESEEVIYDFIRKSTFNQPRKAITTDLKIEYRKPINKLGFKHQFCKFHAKQNINKYIYNYIKNHNQTENDKKEYKTYLKEIYEIFQAKSQTEVLDMINKLIEKISEYPEVIQEIIQKKIIPYSKYLTIYIEDWKIEETSNLIERIFGHTFCKHIKNNYKTIKGLLKRFNIKIRRWDERNAIF